MPDYNPAIASSGLNTGGPDLTRSLSTITDLQRTQAQTGLVQLQALQQQREYNALHAASQSEPGQRALAYIRAGGNNPGYMSGLQQYDSNQASSVNGVLPAQQEQVAGAAEKRAQTANISAEIPGSLAKSEAAIRENVRAGAASAANQYMADPTQANWDAARDYAAKHQGEGAAKQLDAITDPAARMARMTGHVGGGLTAEQGAATVQTQNAKGAPVYQPRNQFLASQASGGATVGQTPAAKAAAVVPAELDKELQTKAQGSVEAIQRLTRLQDAVNTASPMNFGSMLGSETARQAQPIPSLGAEHDNLKSLYTDAGSAMLKSRFGSRVSNMDVSQGMKIVGGTTVQNKATALKIIQNNMSEAYDTIANGLKRGVINANDVLSKPNSKQESDLLGPGAIWMAPDGSIRRNDK